MVTDITGSTGITEAKHGKTNDCSDTEWCTKCVHIIRLHH